MGAIIDYLWAVFYTKWAGMFALLVGIDEFLEWTVPRYRARLNRVFSQRTRRITLLVAFLIFVFVAGFLAWHDERAERLGEHEKHLASEGVSERELRDAREKIAKLETQPRIGEEAQAKIDNLTQVNQQLQQKVAALEQQALPRILTDEQKKKFADALNKVPPGVTYRLTVHAIANCVECSVYTNDLGDVWKKTPGWQVNGTTNHGLDPRLKGVIVAVDMEGCPPEELRLAASALNAAGIKYTTARTEGILGSGTCAVVVGSKPQEQINTHGGN